MGEVLRLNGNCEKDVEIGKIVIEIEIGKVEIGELDIGVEIGEVEIDEVDIEMLKLGLRVTRDEINGGSSISILNHDDQIFEEIDWRDDLP
ncbi:hypothetical protein C5167_011863 [Papaver somniferum]|uniref:Uncharacterized protein n=1 Tax=Papaver somniferum TaxID=3469 RepID=A0A4Y7IZT4_PAPSO|nr:hypothetical protein C5167_011863 [Papaver somniferum]